ncbi:hypothetical protein GCM10010211_66430 [Streptomyces albospinus]|uniref:Uncharacterized protein n=1 Tax=Streptomyces albospinus TaxID=285515 RepID=A0ABQ2VJ89_9ACTN|nr:hypothetical protein GCM10010211_66430 [Streptomyces albospinus]
MGLPPADPEVGALMSEVPYLFSAWWVSGCSLPQRGVHIYQTPGHIGARALPRPPGRDRGKKLYEVV